MALFVAVLSNQINSSIIMKNFQLLILHLLIYSCESNYKKASSEKEVIAKIEIPIGLYTTSDVEYHLGEVLQGRSKSKYNIMLSCFDSSVFWFWVP